VEVTQQYVVLKGGLIGGNTRPGMVLELEAMRGEPLAKRGVVLAVSPKEVAAGAHRAPGAIPIFPDAALQKLLAGRGLIKGDDAPKVSKQSFLRR
jgi:hypothetical protein